MNKILHTLHTKNTLTVISQLIVHFFNNYPSEFHISKLCTGIAFVCSCKPKVKPTIAPNLLIFNEIINLLDSNVSSARNQPKNQFKAC